MTATLTTQAALSVTNLDVAYGNTTVISGLNFEVPNGQHLVLLGASGSGKSTLLNVLGGHLAPSAGHVNVLASAHERAHVFQDHLLLPWLSVRENIALAGKFKAHKASVTAQVVDELLEVVGLQDVADASPASLSGGQAQRASFARALAIKPALLLLDEPFSALDPLTRENLQLWLHDLRLLANLTSVLVTHDLDEALLLGDRIIVLRDGGIAHDLLVPQDAAEKATLRAQLRASYGDPQ